MLTPVLVWISPMSMPAKSLAESNASEEVGRALDLQRQTVRNAVETQRRIDALDEASRKALLEHRSAVEETAELERRNARLERSIRSQEEELASVQRQMREIEETQRAILPLMDRMLETLDRFVELDVPFLGDERSLRLESLHDDWDRPGVSVAEKFRALMKAYRVEADYGHSIEAYQETHEVDGAPTTVDVLRIGRVGLYALGLDGEGPRIWDPFTREWRALDADYRHALRRGLAIARQQAPPELLRLPVRKSEPHAR